MTSVQFAFVGDGGQQYVVLTAGGKRVILSVLPFA